MPCTGGGPIEDDDLLKDAFCSACTALELAGLPIPPAAAPLWAKHKSQDAHRIAQENAVTKTLNLRYSGLSKLTEEERDALGLRGEDLFR